VTTSFFAPPRVRVLGAIAAICAATQIFSALYLVRDFEAPNASTAIARHLAAEGTLAVNAWRQLRGPGTTVPDEGLRAYHLPGEALYLAPAFRLAPAPLLRFLHLPVVLLFVLSVASLAWQIGGRPMALAAGLLAALDPFVIRHGPVWDDTFLAAALTWFVCASLYTGLAAPPPVRHRRLRLALLALAAGWAAITRAESALVCLLVAVVLMMSSVLQTRRESVAVASGVALATAAWGLRNLLVLGVVFFGSTHDGRTLYESNYAFARQSLMESGSVSSFSQTHLTDVFRHVADLGEVEADRYFRRVALSEVASRPYGVAQTALVKIGVSLTGFDFAARLASARNLVAVGFNLLLMVAAAVGLGRLGRHPPIGTSRRYLASVACTIAAVVVCGLAIGPAGLRYRIVLAGVFYVAAASAITAAHQDHSDTPRA
jgi:hypothetical protein